MKFIILLRMIVNPDVEVFRITPIIGECYQYAESTTKRNDKYFTTNPLEYVGKLISIVSTGNRDNHSAIYTFENRIVNPSYEGNTCFIKVNCR